MSERVDVPANCLTPDGTETALVRTLPVEAPIAIEFNGVGYAVMMATPRDLADFGTGFALSERIVDAPGEIEEIEARETPDGWLLKIRITTARADRLFERVRTRVSESSCGLCGLENLEQVHVRLPRIGDTLDVPTDAIFDALASLSGHQPLNAATGGVHAAAFCMPDGAIRLAREDVGRHNALDKLIGAMAAAKIDPASGFALLSSRCSYELVEKTAIAGIPLLVTVSTATSFAVERAQAAGLRLIALARGDAMLELAPEG